jgi:hypothetical protein
MSTAKLRWGVLAGISGVTRTGCLGIEENPLPHLYHDLRQIEDALANAKDDFFYITL